MPQKLFEDIPFLGWGIFLSCPIDGFHFCWRSTEAIVR
jgi:hypothetical protein